MEEVSLNVVEEDVELRPKLDMNRPVLISNSNVRNSAPIHKTVRFNISDDDWKQKRSLEVVTENHGQPKSNLHKAPANRRMEMDQAEDRSLDEQRQDKGRRRMVSFNRFICCLVVSSILFLLCIVIIVNVYNQLSMETTETTTMQLVDMRTFRELLPGLTICTTNTVDLNKLKRMVPDLKSRLDDISRRNTSVLEKYYNKLVALEEYVDMYKEGATISDYLSLSPDNFAFIGEIYCDNDKWVNTKERNNLADRCTNLYRIRSIEKEGTCFTLFHESSLMAAATHRGFDEDNFNNQESIYFMLGIPKKEKTFAGDQILELNVNFHADSYTDVSVPVGGKLLIHSNREIPSVSSAGYALRPGNVYKFYIRKTTVIYKNSKHCTDYLFSYKSRGKQEKFAINLRMAISRQTCIDLCIAAKVQAKCRCWPLHVPYYRDNQTSRRPMFWCGGLLSSVCGYAVTKRRCLEECLPDCHVDRYDVTLSVKEYPNKELLDKEKKTIRYSNSSWTKKKARETLSRLKEDRENKATVKISYSSTQNTVYTIDEHSALPSYGFFVCVLLLVLTGFTVLGIYNLLMVFVDKIANFTTRDNRKIVNSGNNVQ